MALPGIEAPIGGAASPVAVSLLANTNYYVGNTTSATVTFTATKTSQVLVLLTVRNNTLFPPLTIKLNGVDLIRLVEEYPNATGNQVAGGIYVSDGPIALSGTNSLVTTWNSTAITHISAGIMVIDNLESTVPVATSKARGSPGNHTVAVKEGGAVIVAAVTYWVSAGAITWSASVTDVAYNTLESSTSSKRASGGWSLVATDGTVNVTATHPGTTSAACSFVVSLR
jgi:hypothetical protein